MSLRVTLLSLCIMLITSLGVIAQSIEDAQVQEFFTLINADNSIAFFDLFGMDEDTTLYVYAESPDIDTFIGICDIDCESDFFEFNNDIDGRRNRNSAFEYTFEEDGDFTIFVRDCCDNQASGVIRILIGLEAPAVLTGDPFPQGDPFAVIYKPTYVDLSEIDYSDNDTQAQQFYGTLRDFTPAIRYDLTGLNAGQTLYAYAESSEVDTAIGICATPCEDLLIYEDNISTEDSNTSVTFTIPEDGDYRLIVSDCCDKEARGTYRLLLGFNNPLISKGLVLPNGAEIASVFENPHTIVQTDIERDVAVDEDCDDIDLGERPELDEDPEVILTENFAIHYATDGDDEADEDFVDAVTDYVEEVYDIQVNQLGWAAPPRDCGEGGDGRYDFYLIDILDRDGILGYARPDNLIGDNPMTEIDEDWSAYGYMVIDNDYDETTSPLVVMRTTVAHEFHHLIQFGYDINDEAFWLYESTASWVETKTTSDEESDTAGDTEYVMDEPHLCIGSREDRSGLRIYGEWLLLDSIAQDHGDDAIIQLWERLIDDEGLDAFYDFIDDLDTTPEDVLRRYAIRNLLFAYDLGDQFPETVDIEDVIEDFESVDNGRDGVEEMGVQYVFVRDEGRYTFEVDNDDLTMIGVGINPDDDEVTIYDLGTRGTIDTNDYDYTYIIIMNTDEHDNPEDCREEDWEITVSDGDRDDLSEITGETFDVSNFDPAD